MLVVEYVLCSGKIQELRFVFRKRVCKDKWNECHKTSPLYPNYTVDFWIKLKSGVRNGIMSKGNGGGNYSFDIMEESDGRIFFGLEVWWNPRGCNMLFYDATGSVGSSCDRQVTISILESVCKWSVAVWFHINDGFRVLCSLMIGKYRDYGLYLNGMILRVSHQ